MTAAYDGVRYNFAERKEVYGMKFIRNCAVLFSCSSIA